MAKKTATKTTVAPSVATPATPPAPDIRWALPIGLTVISDERVDVTSAPTAEQRAERQYRHATTILPAIRAALMAAGFNVVDDMELVDEFAIWPTGAVAKVVYPPKAKVVKVKSVTADGTHNADEESAPGPLAQSTVADMHAPIMTGVEHPADKKPTRKRKH